MRLTALVKTPAEVLVHTVNLAGRAVTVDPVAATPRGLVVAPAELTVEELLVAGNLELRLSGGSDGELYAIEAAVTLANGELAAIPIEVSVIDGAWAMPDGGAPMLSVAGFVARVGRDQVLRLTDLGDGRIDRGLVIAALADAQAQVEVYLSGRYQLPFATVPPIVEAIVADLARAGLYEDELPKNIEEKRRIALRNLEGFRDGKLQLGIAPAAAPGQASDPVRFNPGTRTYPDDLAGYGFR